MFYAPESRLFSEGSLCFQRALALAYYNLPLIFSVFNVLVTNNSYFLVLAAKVYTKTPCDC